MIKLIDYLKAYNIPVMACCCGHGKYKPTIVVSWYEMGSKHPINMELLSMTKIPRKKRFYKKDKEGFYYIPEVINEN